MGFLVILFRSSRMQQTETNCMTKNQCIEDSKTFELVNSRGDIPKTTRKAKLCQKFDRLSAAHLKQLSYSITPTYPQNFSCTLR